MTWLLAELKHLSCTTHKLLPNPGRRRNYGRSGGYLVAVTPDGFMRDVVEFTGAEILTQRCFFVAGPKEQCEDLALILHGGACLLRRFAGKRQNDCDFAKLLVPPAMTYILGRFRARFHKDGRCLQRTRPEVGLSD